MLNVTTSWDDGDILDVRLADLLATYKVPGTFYIAKEYRESRLSRKNIIDLSKLHEVGAHTITHPDMRALTARDMQEEINTSKTWLEETLGTKIQMFCYPRGFHDDIVVGAVKAAGFRGARTTQLGSISEPKDPFRIDTTLQVYPFPLRKLSKKTYHVRKILEPYRQRASALRAIGVPGHAMLSWVTTAKAAFDAAYKQGQVFHLWGHSWEIEKYGMWSELEEVLQYISNRQDCNYVTNGQLIQ